MNVEKLIGHSVQVAMKQYEGCSRLIPRTRSQSLEEGIKAKVKDPLWFLTRQWQLGEFRARNGGKIVRAELSTSTQEVDEIRTDRGGDFRPLTDPDLPIEPLVEQEVFDAQPGTSPPPAWSSEQLEYRFELKAGDAILESSEYCGDRLDWYDFALGSAIGPGGKSEFYSVIPQGVSFPGMPNARWWRFEDGKTDIGDIRRPNLNFLSMLLIEFALVYSNDWFVIPVRQKVGSIRTIDALAVIDTFGMLDSISPIVDATADEHLWTMYTLAARRDCASPGSSMLFLPNVVVRAQESDAIEQVLVSRDELANVVWAIEKRYCSAQKGIVNREREEAPADAVLDSGAQYPSYRLKSILPSHWIPYVATQKSREGDIVLRRGRTDARATQANPQYKGQFINESKRISEEEVPAFTLELTRKYKLVHYGREEWELSQRDGSQKFRLERTQSPKQRVWIGRNQKPGLRQGSSGLKYDYLIEK